MEVDIDDAVNLLKGAAAEKSEREEWRRRRKRGRRDIAGGCQLFVFCATFKEKSERLCAEIYGGISGYSVEKRNQKVVSKRIDDDPHTHVCIYI